MHSRTEYFMNNSNAAIMVKTGPRRTSMFTAWFMLVFLLHVVSCEKCGGMFSLIPFIYCFVSCIVQYNFIYLFQYSPAQLIAVRVIKIS